jgi:hypothetical protein
MGVADLPGFRCLARALEVARFGAVLVVSWDLRRHVGLGGGAVGHLGWEVLLRDPADWLAARLDTGMSMSLMLAGFFCPCIH